MAARVYDLPIQDTQNVYGLICRSLLPVGMLGMMIAAMFSATMSMLSSDYNATAAVITNDIYKRWAGDSVSDRKLIWVGRFATLFIGLIALGIGLLVDRWAGNEDLFKVMADFASVLIPPIGIPMLVGLVSRRISPAAGIVGFAMGVLAGAIAYSLSFVEGGLGGFSYSQLKGVTLMTWVTSIPTLVGMYAASLFLHANPREREKIDRFIDHVEAHGKAEEVASEQSSIDFAPLTLVGYSIGILGCGRPNRDLDLRGMGKRMGDHGCGRNHGPPWGGVDLYSIEESGVGRIMSATEKNTWNRSSRRRIHGDDLFRDGD